MGDVEIKTIKQYLNQEDVKKNLSLLEGKCFSNINHGQIDPSGQSVYTFQKV